MNLLLRLQETTMCSSVYSGDGLQLDLTSFVSNEVESRWPRLIQSQLKSSGRRLLVAAFLTVVILYSQDCSIYRFTTQHSVVATKKVKVGFVYSATYTVNHRDQPRFTILEVAVDWQEPTVLQRKLRPSIARVNVQLDPRYAVALPCVDDAQYWYCEWRHFIASC